MFFESRSNRFITYFQEEIFSFLREKLLKAQEKMKQQARLKQTDIEFKEGDWVYLQLQPFRQRSVFPRSDNKLSARFLPT